MTKDDFTSPATPQEAVSFLTTSLGCRVNQAETGSLRQALLDLGWQPAPVGQPAQVVVLLTCAVTGQASRQSRQMARRLAREHPGARLVISGCDVQNDPSAYGHPGMTPLGRSHLARLPELLAGPTLPATPCSAPDAGSLCPGVAFPGGQRSRAMLKVQDGCDAACAYCIVPLTRGRPRSLPPSQACAAWQDLAQGGAHEVVLTGIHLGRWGGDLHPAMGLDQLVTALLDSHPGPRLRLSSLESREVTPQLLAMLTQEPRLCRHLHLPLQSGSDEVLAAMGRPYTAQEYAALAWAAAAAVPGLCLGADVLVGLPGEDQAAFEATWRLLASLPLGYLHVFPYSPRPGTKAALMGGRPPSSLVKERTARLRRLGEEKRLAFHQAQVGSQLQVIVEGSGLGRADNYCLVQCGGLAPGQSTARVMVTGVGQSRAGLVLQGQVLSSPDLPG